MSEPTLLREERAGDWMQTYTGIAFFPLDPRVADIDPDDIAHALAMICRYGGHTRRFYTVAEHCVKMSQAVSPENALWALLHDATEAYVGDMIRPLKRQILQYRDIERNLMDHICARFDLDPTEPEEVYEADNRILLDERAALMVTPPPLPWHQDEAKVEPLGVGIECWPPARAFHEYNNRLNHLLRKAAR